MIWLYRVLLPILFFISLPYYLWRMLKRGGYKKMISGRLGNITIPEKSNKTKRIWIQAVSVGELLAIESVVRELAKIPNTELVISTTTSTGYTLAKEKYKDIAIAICPFPLDFWFAVHKSWKRINPDLAIITEGELWPEHIQTAKDRKVPMLLINARLSDRSYQRMSKLKKLRSLFYQNITHIGASSEFDHKRIESLGYSTDKITTSGNLKFDVVDPEGLSEADKNDLKKSIGFLDTDHSKQSHILIGASTWPGEEELLIQSGIELNARGHSTKVLIVPRHAERRAEIRSLLKKFGSNVHWSFRSQPNWKLEKQNEKSLQVYIADTTGELRNFIQLADAALIGKSFPPHGQGQTPVEAVAFGIPVIYGGPMTNFKAICADLEQNQACVRNRDPEQLANEIEALLNDATLRKNMTQAAHNIFKNSQGSTQRTLQIIQSHF